MLTYTKELNKELEDNQKVNTNKVKILLVEDDLIQVDLFELFLTDIYNTDLDFTSCNTIDKAKELISNNYYDLIILDLNLEDSSGINTLNSIKDLSTSSIVVISGALLTKEDVNRIKESNVDLISKKGLEFSLDLQMLFYRLILRSKRKRLSKCFNHFNGNLAYARNGV